MKLILAIAIIILSKVSLGQDLIKQKAAIDAEVERISKQGKLKTGRFSIQALKKVLHYIKYQYIENSSGYIKISRQFSHKNDTIQQTFYVKNGGLIYATEKITSYFTDNGKTDSIVWSGDFYFANSKLIDHITLGHGKSEFDNWNPQQDMLTAFRESKRDIARYKKKNNGG
jgi:hypothetical protein